MSVARAQREISAREFGEWLAYFGLDPYGNGRGDLQAALVCAVMANCHRGKADKAFEPADFMPKFDPPQTEQQSVEVMQAKVRLALGAGKGRGGDSGKSRQGLR